MTEDVESQNPASNEETKALNEEKPVTVKPAAAAGKTAEPSITKGLTKEELMKFANDPFWIRLRLILFVLFWCIWLAMLVASVVIIIYAPKCPSPEPKTWWQKGPIYKIEAKDAKADGSSFFKSVESELDYMVEAGFNTIHLGNIFHSSDDGVDDYLAVSPDLGSLDEWKELTVALEQRNMKVMIDLDPSSTSVNHEWFVNADSAYPDFYLADSNNLNLNNPKVVAKLESVVDHWIQLGVSGFNINSDTLITDIINSNQDATNLIHALRQTTDKEEHTEPKILAAFTSLSLASLSPLYGDKVEINHVGSLFHLATGQPLVTALPAQLTANSLFDFVQEVQTALPNNSWTGVALSSDTQRVGDAHPDMIDALNMLVSMLPATPIINAGDELGVMNGVMNWNMMANQTAAALEGRRTHFGVFSQLAELRHQETILFGDVRHDELDGCLVITRTKKGNPGFILIINLTDNEVTLDVSTINRMAETIRLKTASILAGDNFSLPDPAQPSSFPTKEVKMEAKAAKLFTFVPKF